MIAPDLYGNPRPREGKNGRLLKPIAMPKTNPHMAPSLVKDMEIDIHLNGNKGTLSHAQGQNLTSNPRRQTHPDVVSPFLGTGGGLMGIVSSSDCAGWAVRQIQITEGFQKVGFIAFPLTEHKGTTCSSDSNDRRLTISAERGFILPGTSGDDMTVAKSERKSNVKATLTNHETGPKIMLTTLIEACPSRNLRSFIGLREFFRAFLQHNESTCGNTSLPKLQTGGGLRRNQSEASSHPPAGRDQLPDTTDCPSVHPAHIEQQSLSDFFICSVYSHPGH
jgi:hypothetical protein